MLFDVYLTNAVLKELKMNEEIALFHVLATIPQTQRQCIYV